MTKKVRQTAHVTQGRVIKKPGTSPAGGRTLQVGARRALGFPCASSCEGCSWPPARGRRWPWADPGTPQAHNPPEQGTLAKHREKTCPHSRGHRWSPSSRESFSRIPNPRLATLWKSTEDVPGGHRTVLSPQFQFLNRAGRHGSVVPLSTQGGTKLHE